MKVARPPVGDRLETLLAKVFVAVLLPVAPRVGMAVERVDHRTDWVTNFVPVGSLGPLRFRDANPRFDGRLQLALRVGSFSVSLLALMSRDKGVAVDRFSGLHGAWAADQLLEDCCLPVVVLDVVALLVAVVFARAEILVQIFVIGYFFLA